MYYIHHLPHFVKYPFVIFSQYVWKTHPRLFPVPRHTAMHSLPVGRLLYYVSLCYVMLSLRNGYRLDTLTDTGWIHFVPAHRHAVRIIEGFCGSENSIIYVMVTAPPLFSAPRGWGSGPGSGSGFGIGLPKSRRPPSSLPKSPHFADRLFSFYILPPAFRHIMTICHNLPRFWFA